jgi:hypothetical protein
MALFTNSQSPTRGVDSIEADGIRKAWITKAWTTK